VQSQAAATFARSSPTFEAHWLIEFSLILMRESGHIDVHQRHFAESHSSL
jgi:hypothetical protein